MSRPSWVTHSIGADQGEGLGGLRRIHLLGAQRALGNGEEPVGGGFGSMRPGE